MDKKVWWVLGAVVILGGGVYWYTSVKPAPATTLTIGVIAPLTGNFAGLGENMRAGFTLAEEELEQEGVIESIDIIIEDACQPQQAVSAVQKLITTDRIDILGGSFCVVGFVPVVPILEEAGIITFNTAPNPDDVLNKPYVVSTNSSIREKARQLGEFAATKLNGKTAAIIYYNTPLGKDYEKYFRASFEATGGAVISSEVTAVDATDFRTQLTKVKAADPDVLFVVELANPLGNLLKQARELDIDSTILGNSQNEDPTVLAAAGQAAEGFYISSDEPAPKSEETLRFEKRFMEKYGRKPDVFAANAYDALRIQVAAYAECEGNTACMLTYIKELERYPGVSGSITINDDGSASKGTSFKVVRNGAFIPVE